MQRSADVGVTALALLTDPAIVGPDESPTFAQNDLPPSPTSSTGTPVFVTATPRSDTPVPSGMSGTFPPQPLFNIINVHRFLGCCYAS